MLRQKARQRVGSQEFIALDTANKSAETTGHINFFEEVEEGTAEFKKSNKEHDKEKKEEQEKYEKQIGYLTYLGQDTNEALGKKNWYDVMPDRSTNCDEGEVGLKSKLLHDPLTVIKKYTDGMKPKEQQLSQKVTKHVFPITSYSSERSSKGSERSTKRRRSSGSDYSEKRHKAKKKKHKKHKSKKKHKESSSDSASEVSEEETVRQEKKRKLEILRMERLAREREERKKAEMLLAKINGVDTTPKEVNKIKSPVKQKYNSQFNPELAKQNYNREN